MEFPHLVEMHQRYAKDGLEVISVCLDDPEDPAAKANALRFLRAQGPAFPTLLLADRSPLMRQTFDFDTIPCVFVLDRTGQPQKFEGNFTLRDVDRVVRASLKS